MQHLPGPHHIARQVGVVGLADVTGVGRPQEAVAALRVELDLGLVFLGFLFEFLLLVGELVVQPGRGVHPRQREHGGQDQERDGDPQGVEHLVPAVTAAVGFVGLLGDHRGQGVVAQRHVIALLAVDVRPGHVQQVDRVGRQHRRQPRQRRRAGPFLLEVVQVQQVARHGAVGLADVELVQ